MTTQHDTSTSGAEAPAGVPSQPAAAKTGFAATDVLVNEFGAVDTVERAFETPDELQPHTELGLKDDEYDRIRQILGRRPTASELAMYSIMWSEHCSYKSSKVHLRQFGEKAPKNTRMLAGIGENAGVVQISDELAVTFKVESHNHPSYVEPYQGAATGVGGIVRDILAMGARPVAVMDPLRFGAADHPDTARVLPGVVAGIGGYGNCLGLPNIGGEIVFDPCYQGNPLVNALSIGVLPVERLQHKEAAGIGNIVVLLGARTGRDGIGGVSVLASATFDEGAEQRRPSVQVGDPFMEKLLIESCLELYDAGLVAGIQDLGGAGLTCALTETAAAAGTGMRVWLERVPLREASMSPTEILASESQERMLLIVTPEKLDEVLAVAEKWGVWATAIGEVTPSESDGHPGRLLITWNDQTVVDVPPGSLADDGPVYARPIREPADLILLQADRAETLPRPTTPEELRETVLRMIASPNLCDKTWVTEQYDRYVLGNTVLAQPEDAGVLRIDEKTGLGVALSVDGNGRYARLDPYEGAKLGLAEAYRNVAVTGAEPIAVTDCLNFGSPEDPAVMWQFAEAVRGLADGCQQLGIPVTGGNVSFYNQTGAAAIHPTPVVGVLGVLDDVASRVPMGFPPPPSADGDLLFLLGDTECELSGSEWAWVTHGHLGGRPPKVDLAHEQRLGKLMSQAAEREHIVAAHDLSDGGLSQVLVESCLRRNVGARITLPGHDEAVTPFVWLFSESAGRALVAVPRGHDKAFLALAKEHGVSCTPIGATTEEPVLDIQGQFTLGLDELREAFTATMRNLFGGSAEVGTRAIPDAVPAASRSVTLELTDPAATNVQPAGTASGSAGDAAEPVAASAPFATATGSAASGSATETGSAAAAGSPASGSPGAAGSSAVSGAPAADEPPASLPGGPVDAKPAAAPAPTDNAGEAEKN
ncbi:phosphoribosylformylglycinamidine synthase subunit PurL [Actinoplanes sp. N902-109]|uniref:phosphoribosylformylglycinamidine synthase subunit PurL n=1 Tax=Actinoplanes sp. (strain N902-109) TaxID=649831 RepID=UPI0003295BAC|nr:phosphoribosylformylglycinamidine synthase subunit PurL [Actinoplanes sp. N902-109]AGL13644.1 phosphoribosylformylglycinamidine synthase ii [Actinoplanes sp. N902-109]